MLGTLQLKVFANQADLQWESICNGKAVHGHGNYILQHTINVVVTGLEKSCSTKKKSADEIWATILPLHMWSQFLLDISVMFPSHISDLLLIKRRELYIFMYYWAILVHSWRWKLLLSQLLKVPLFYACN